jgi:hypothetical protein
MQKIGRCCCWKTWKKFYRCYGEDGKGGRDVLLTNDGSKNGVLLIAQVGNLSHDHQDALRLVKVLSTPLPRDTFPFHHVDITPLLRNRLN